jgi:NADH-quinone oxidoreductase subunit H
VTEILILRSGFDFNGIYGFFDEFMPDSLDWLVFLITSLILAIVIINAVVLSTALLTWFERRLLGRFQSRLGPNRWGPFGLLQPIADLVSLLTKEDTIPEGADKPIFTLAPIVFLAPALIVFSVIPLHGGSFLGNLNVGLIFVIAITSINTLAVFMAGWSSLNKYAMFGAMRAVAMLISYEIPMGITVVAVALVAQTLGLSDVVLAQDIPYILVMPLAFLVFITAASAEMSRTPFDLIESDSELGAGYHTEYSGAKFALLQLTEFMAPIIVAALVTTLFLSGWRGYGPIPGPVWFVIKTFIVLFGFVWIRASWPRLRVDQIMGLAWKGLLPLSIINLFVVAIEVFIFNPGENGLSTTDLWIMTGVNWGVTIIAIFAIFNLLGQSKSERPVPVISPLANMYANTNTVKKITDLAEAE